MNVIEFDRRKPSADDPRKLEYAGQRTAAEVFEELKHRLESQGYLPDEYFLLDSFWENGREIPKDAGIFCTTDYGASEGVYLDAYLKWYDKGHEKSVTQKFFTGKTLGENGNDLDRMFLISSAITKAFQGDHATYARYTKIGGVEEDTGGRVVHLSRQEEKVIIDALVEQRERQEQAMSQTEQLLRRMTGSITAYMDTVGQRPLRLDDYDRAVLAIRDGELGAFQTLLPNLKDRAHDLLVEAAGRPGMVGRKMTVSLLSDVDAFPEPAYRAACMKAIDIDDFEKVSFLLAEAENHVPGLSASFHGEMASQAYLEHRSITREIVKQCTDEQIAAAPPHLLEQFAADKDWRTLLKLVEKGISGGSSAWRTLHMLTYEGRDSWIAEDMLKKRMWVDTNDYDALHACVKNDAVEVCKLLLNGGMDFDQYRQWAETRPCAGHEETLQALAEHWAELKAAQEQEQAPVPQQTGGMTLG
ncbi:ankyrin repeat domain-containing protein [uncultured Oscillibacter sp.]|uniref:ankyrin repeat domain-containing protein n=1 Tax=uncultured Oscillibacter sp. TaxID=876091 RepID=UPI00261BC9F1|nr:ankyrin repeat domain-containing protein [uncultured Oscillibacter sp.]